jgi:6-pyruvoyltetrahydropterin/6-carboxytetrahydropterin synthase
MAEKPIHLENDLSQPVELRVKHPVAMSTPLPEDPAFWTVDESRVLNPLQGLYTFSYTIFFTSYHQVMNKNGFYGEVHPHSYRLNVKVQAKATFLDNKIVLPYESIRETLNKISQAYEGKMLNRLPPFKQMQPTTENLTGVLWQQLEYLTKVKPFKVLEITLMESPTIGVTYSR